MTRVEYVLDACAVALSVVDDPRSDGYRAWFESVIAEDGRLISPSLMRYELAQTIFKNYDHERLRADPDLFVDLVREATNGIDLDEDAWFRCGRWAGRLSAYDASYLALAESREATLVTYDKQLANVAKEHVAVIGPDGLD